MTLQLVLSFFAVLGGLFFALSGKKTLFILTAFSYTAGVLYITLASRIASLGSISVAFTTYQISSYVDLAAFILNVLLFVPFGYLFEILLSRHLKGAVVLVSVLGFLFSACIECTQYITGLGVFDVVDLAANTSGAVAGAVLSDLILKLRNHEPLLRRRYSIS